MYRRKGPHRLRGYDYASEGIYFITICTHNREHFFGEVGNEKIMLSDTGSLVQEEWQKTSEIRKNINLTLDAFCVMHAGPNHFHALLQICLGLQFHRGVLGGVQGLLVQVFGLGNFFLMVRDTG